MEWKDLEEKISSEKSNLEEQINILIYQFEDKFQGCVRIIPIRESDEAYKQTTGGRVQLGCTINATPLLQG